MYKNRTKNDNIKTQDRKDDEERIIHPFTSFRKHDTHLEQNQNEEHVDTSSSSALPKPVLTR